MLREDGEGQRGEKRCGGATVLGPLGRACTAGMRHVRRQSAVGVMAALGWRAAGERHSPTSRSETSSPRHATFTSAATTLRFASPAFALSPPSRRCRPSTAAPAIVPWPAAPPPSRPRTLSPRACYWARAASARALARLPRPCPPRPCPPRR